MSKAKPAITADQANDAFAEFRKDTALLSLIADANPASIMLFKAVRDKNGNIEDLEFLFANRQALESMERTDLVGKSFTKEFPFTKTTGLVEHYINVIETGNAWSDDTYYVADGIECWAKVNALKLGDGCLVSYLDITEQKKATDELLRVKEELAQSATDKYYNLFNSIDQGFCILEVIFNEQVEPVDFRYIIINPAFEKHSGLKDATGKTLLEVVPNIDRAIVAAYRSVAVTGEPIRLEGYVKDLDKWFDVYSFLVDAPGDRHIAVLFSDITARKQTEEFIRHSEEKQAYLLRLSDAIRTLDSPAEIQNTAARILGQQLHVDRAYYTEKINKDGVEYFEVNYVYHGPGAVEIAAGLYPVSGFGKMPAELAEGRNVISADVNNDAHIDAAERANFLSNHIHAFIVIPLIKNGKLVAAFGVQQHMPREWNKEEIILMEETAERTWAAVVRAQAETALRESENQLRQTKVRLKSALEAGLAGTFFWDVVQDKVITDDNMMEYFSLSEKALTEGVPLSEVLPAIYEEDRPKVAQELNNAIEKTGVYFIEYRVNHPDGKLRWLSARGLVERDDTGTTVALPGFVVDITRIKEAEEFLLKSEEKYRSQLEQEVNERTDEINNLNNQLQMINRELEARNTELKTFNSIAANDYNETLRHLYTSMEYIISHDARHLSDAGRANIRRAQASIQKMKLLTEDIVSYTKLHEAVKKKEPVNLNRVIENVLSDFEKKMDVSSITVNCGKMPSITGYPFLISLVFHHLIDNAIKFRKDTENLGIQVSCTEWVNGSEIANEAAQSQWVYHVISITDNGIGFSQQYAQSIFEIFYRVADKAKHRGSGIGLAVCKKIMQMHHGFITGESEPGTGSTFHCYFPVKEKSTV